MSNPVVAVIDHEGRVVLQFMRPTTSFSLDPENALALAEVIARRARELMGDAGAGGSNVPTAS